MIVKDLLEKPDKDLVEMLKGIRNEPIEHTPIILAELSRRSIVRLQEETSALKRSSSRLEKLTIALIVLTVVLAILGVPPMIETLRHKEVSVQESSRNRSVGMAEPTLLRSPQPNRIAFSDLSNEDLFFLGASKNRRLFPIGQVTGRIAKQPAVGQRFEIMGKQYVISRILGDGLIAADEQVAK